MMGRKLDNLIGKKFGMLRIVKRLPNHGRSTVWLVKCKCGTEKPMMGSVLRNNTVSCGCHRRRVLATSAITHGMSHKVPEYNVWQGMLRRCDNRKSKQFKNYGGRGIIVCERWKGASGFVNFISDMGSRPSPSHTIERRETSGNYEPSNCYWLPRSEQNNNKRTARRLTMNGRTMSIRDWARETGLSKGLIAARIDRLGWTVERSLSMPARPMMPRTNY